MDRTYFLLNKINVMYELSIILEKIENNKYIIFDKFMDFLLQYNTDFN